MAGLRVRPPGHIAKHAVFNPPESINMSIGVFIRRLTGKKTHKYCVATPRSHIKTSPKFSPTTASLTATIGLQKGRFLSTHARTPTCPKLLCYVSTTKNCTSSFSELRMQSGCGSTYLQQRCQEV